MSTSPPEHHAPSVPDDAVTQVRGAQRTGRAIWILIISVGAAAVLLLGYTLLHAPRMGAINHPQPRDENAKDISTFNTPGGSARTAPPGEPSTTGNSQ